QHHGSIGIEAAIQLGHYFPLTCSFAPTGMSPIFRVRHECTIPIKYHLPSQKYRFLPASARATARDRRNPAGRQHQRCGIAGQVVFFWHSSAHGPCPVATCPLMAEDESPAAVLL